jgi:plastocyanin
MARHRRPLALAAAAAALLIAGGALALGRGQDDPTPARDGRIAVRLTDFRYHPQRIAATPGPLTFELRNEGRLAHNFRLLRNGNEVLQLRTLKPGATASATRRVRAGTYRFLCPLQNHAELGMYGSLVVR